MLELRERTGARAAARADELLPHPRRLAGGARSATTSSPADVPARLPAEQGAQAARRRPDARSSGRPTPTLEWAPPGHGDLYTALVTLRACSTRCSSAATAYAFVSNADNLGAVLDPRILAWFAREEIPFADGGRRPHRGRPQGRPPRAPARTAGWCCARSRRRPTRTSTPSRTSTRHRYFNTNNLWVDLRALARGARRARRRARAADDRQPQDRRPGATRRSPAVIQLETAMGAAIDVFDGAARAARAARALRAGEDDERPARAALGRLRARPTTRASSSRPSAAAARRSSTSTPATTSCSRDFEARFPAGAPSLVDCERLRGRGRRRVRRGRRRARSVASSTTAARSADRGRRRSSRAERSGRLARGATGDEGDRLSHADRDIPAAMVPVLDPAAARRTAADPAPPPRASTDDRRRARPPRSASSRGYFGLRARLPARTSRWAPRARSRRAAS